MGGENACLEKWVKILQKAWKLTDLFMDRRYKLFQVFRFTIVVTKEILFFGKISKLKIKKINPNQKAIDKKKNESWTLQEQHVTTLKIFHDGDCYHIETSPLICRANLWTGFYMITASVMKELKTFWLLNLQTFCLF